MARLAIKKHETRGSEVIELLEMLGGINSRNLYGDENYAYYTIDADNEIIGTLPTDKFVFYSLERFIGKYPYKVGDKVNYVKYNDEYPSVYTIQKIRWTGATVEYLFDSNGFSALTKDLQPYKEETREEEEENFGECIEKTIQECLFDKEETMETITIDDFKANTKEWLIDKLESMSKDNALQAICNIHDELQKSKYPKTYKECCGVLGLNTKEETMEDKLIPRIDLAGYCKDKYIIDLGNYEIKQENGKTYAVRKQPKYPQTCEECLNVLSKAMRSLDNMNGYKFGALMHFQQLLICRDAYWKIAGEQMGLGKPWEPDWNSTEYKYVIYTSRDEIVQGANWHTNSILVFPTEEMRDAFYENFKDFIEERKEFL